MQILHDDRKKGIFKVQVENLDDLWVLYNIIRPNDLIKARTTRRVIFNEGDKGDRKPMTLQIRVENVEFHEYSNRLRIKGTITEGPQDLISIGQYHTLNIEIGSRLYIIKDKWYMHEIKRLQKSTQSSQNKIILIMAIESGLATISLLSNYSINTVATIQHNIPGKRFPKQNKEKEIEKFFKNIYSILSENINKLNIKLLIIVGPGFFKEQIQTYLKENFKKNNINVDIRVATASSGTESGIYEALKSGVITQIISDHKVSREIQFMEEFIAHLGKNDGLYAYGMDDIMKAANIGAIEHLLIADTLMRTIGHKIENELEKLFDLIEKTNGNIHIVSSNTPAGEQLEKFGGIIALLRFKIYE
ncbi:MAG: mRNA surveillance protein pelota [Promethearchaeota archaeon]